MTLLNLSSLYPTTFLASNFNMFRAFVSGTSVFPYSTLLYSTLLYCRVSSHRYAQCRERTENWFRNLKQKGDARQVYCIYHDHASVIFRTIMQYV